MRARSGQGPPGRAIAALAEHQHGVVSLAQLLAAGLSRSAVSRAVAHGRLHRIHRGVFAVGHARVTGHGRWMAAVLCCGDGAVLSHRSAAALLGLRHTAGVRIDVRSPPRRGSARPGIAVHRAGTLAPAEAMIVDGIPCTSVARTLLDLAAVVRPRELARAVDRAEELRRLDLRAVDVMLARNARRPWTATLRSVLAERAEPAVTHSELEERFLALCAEAAIPRPLVNALIDAGGESFRVDFAWPCRRLIVETDGRRYHRSSNAFERDRRRDQRLMVAGWRVMRCSWRQVVLESARIAGTVAGLLRATTPSSAPGATASEAPGPRPHRPTPSCSRAAG